MAQTYENVAVYPQLLYVWNTNTLTWDRMTQPVLNGGSITVSGSVGVSNFPTVFPTKSALAASAPDSQSVTGVTGQIVAANSSRTGLVVTNLGNGNVFLGFGANDAVGSFRNFTSS